MRPVLRILALGLGLLCAVRPPLKAQGGTLTTTPPACPDSSVLAHWTPNIPNVLLATRTRTCPAFKYGIEQWFQKDTAAKHWTLAQGVAFITAGIRPAAPTPPPIDTTPVTPPSPIDTAPKPPVVPSPPLTGQLDTLINKTPMGPLKGPTIIVPHGWAGRPLADIQPGGGCAAAGACVTGEGAVRILTKLAFMANIDPIVFPGDTLGLSHLHQFFGNSRLTTNSTSDSTTFLNCSSTNSGGAANCTTYWTPAMVDANGQIVPPTDTPDGQGTVIYYKVGYEMDERVIQPAPTGLKMIAGDKMWADPLHNQARVWWTCADSPGPQYSSVIPDCVGRVQLIVIFPQCWDGVHLDSPDHKSHMSYPNYANFARGSKCPAAFPTAIPEITELFYWSVPKGVKSSTWHISSDMDMTRPGGLSAHADWMMGWRPEIMRQLVTGCLNQNKDVGTNGLCNNTYLNPPPLR